jgi:cysteine sulfinate desulfinase/cysteine desulfurase-like protein
MIKIKTLNVCVSQDPRVLDKMMPYLVSFYGNPHSRTHAYGWESEAAMEKARQVGNTTPPCFYLLNRLLN